MHNSNTLDTPAEQTQASPQSANEAAARKPYLAPRLEQLTTNATNFNSTTGNDGAGTFTAS